MAVILQYRGEYDQALKLLNESLEIARQLGDQHGISKLLDNIAAILLDRGEYDQALKLLNESLEIARQLGDQHGIALNLGEIGALFIDRGRYIEALTNTFQAYKILERLHNPDAKYFWDNLNRIRNALGDKEYQERLKK